MKSVLGGLLAIAGLIGLAGCERDERCCPVPEPSAAMKDGAAPGLPKVAGKWVGRWESAGHPGHGGGLKCEASESGAQKWEAVFMAEFGQTKAYNVKLEGKPGDGAVLFGGSVDLGKKDGGVFTWTGKATATEFNGKYEGGGDTGTFKMNKMKRE